jgi:hypothetical protein
MTEFITARFPEAEMPRVQTQAEALERVRGFVRQGERARIREAGGEFGPWRREKDAIERLRTRMSRMGVGPKLIVQRQRDMGQLSIREVERESVGLGCAPALEQIHYGLWEQFKGQLRSAGRWLCRNVDGSSTVSRHGYFKPDPNGWHGAAEDIFPEDEAGLAEVAHFTIDKTKAGVWRAQTVIWLRRIWTPGQGEHEYTGTAHYHDHIDVLGGQACSP